MRWRRGSRSTNLEDRRGATGRIGARRATGLGLGGVAIALVASLVFGQDFFSVLNLVGGAGGGGSNATGQSSNQAPVTTAEEERSVDFMSFVIDDIQETWEQAMPQYRRANLVLFRQAVQTACGVGRAASGPFYCPGDGKAYLDLSFFDELQRRFGAPGDFAQAYVIAHEIGHHLQNIMGTENQVRQAQRGRPDQRNQLSVLMELQADCYAGVWGYSAAQRGVLDPGDVEEGLTAAAAIGDDRIQEQATGYVNPEAFTHGSSAQRVRWFRTGFESGDPNRCDTFSR